MFDWMPLIGDMPFWEQTLWLALGCAALFLIGIAMFGIGEEISPRKDQSLWVVPGLLVFGFGAVLGPLFAVMFLFSGVAAVIPDAAPSDPPERAIDYGAPAEPMKAEIVPDLDRVSYTVSGTRSEGFDPVADPDDFTLQSETVETLGAVTDGSTEVQFLGKRTRSAFEIRGFRIRVGSPLPPRRYSGETIDSARKSAEYDWSKRLLASRNTPPPVSLSVGIADLEAYQVGNRRSIRSYWINNNPLFQIDGILQDGTWQSAYLRQPIQLTEGQQYIMSVVYEMTEYCYIGGLFGNSERCDLYSQTFAQIPVTIN